MNISLYSKVGQVEIKAPKYKVGDKCMIVASINDQYPETINGVIVSNNTIDFVDLVPLYNIDFGQVDFLGRKVIIENIKEEYINLL